MIETIGVEAPGLTPPTPRHSYYQSRIRPSHSTVVAPRFVPQLRLPSLKHFSLACAAFLDNEAASTSMPTGPEPSTCAASRRIGISVFVILSDQCRRFPRPRLSSLPQGLPTEVTILF